jgi:hypothetical protein
MTKWLMTRIAIRVVAYVFMLAFALFGAALELPRLVDWAIATYGAFLGNAVGVLGIAGFLGVIAITVWDTEWGVKNVGQENRP